MSSWPERRAAPGPQHYLAMLATCPYVYVGDAGGRGLGVFTARPVAAGTVILADDDGSLHRRAMPLAAALAQGWDRQRHLFQLDHDLFLPPRGCFDDLINHSCEPSGGFLFTAVGLCFVAIRDLAAGEELTYDYSCHLLSLDEQMACACETPSCRGVIGPFGSLSKPLQQHYLALGVASSAVRRSVA